MAIQTVFSKDRLDRQFVRHGIRRPGTGDGETLQQYETRSLPSWREQDTGLAPRTDNASGESSRCDDRY